MGLVLVFAAVCSISQLLTFVHCELCRCMLVKWNLCHWYHFSPFLALPWGLPFCLLTKNVASSFGYEAEQTFCSVKMRTSTQIRYNYTLCFVWSKIWMYYNKLTFFSPPFPPLLVQGQSKERHALLFYHQTGDSCNLIVTESNIYPTFRSRT